MRKVTTSFITVTTIFILSATGAFLLFNLLESQAVVQSSWLKAGGAVAGFIILYVMLDRSFCRILQLKEPCLSGKQTLALIHLFQEDVKYHLLRAVFGWIDEVESGRELPYLLVQGRLAHLSTADSLQSCCPCHP